MKTDLPLDAYTILLAEDDDGHAELIREQLIDACVASPLLRFRDGQEVLDFFNPGAGRYRPEQAYLLILDIRMPKVDGVRVLRWVKAQTHLRNIPVIMLTTTDDPAEIATCYQLGCNCYINKPIKFASFEETLRRLGLFIRIMRITRAM